MEGVYTTIATCQRTDNPLATTPATAATTTVAPSADGGAGSTTITATTARPPLAGAADGEGGEDVHGGGVHVRPAVWGCVAALFLSLAL